MFCTSVCSTSPSAWRTSFCNFDSRVTAAAAGIDSNIYSCQFLPIACASSGNSVDRFEAIVFF